MIYLADWLLTGEGSPVRNGWIQVEGNRIVATGSASGLPEGVPVQRFAGCALLPGLVNAHCHLELTTLQGRLDSGNSFPVWVEQLRAYTAGLDSTSYHHAAYEGVRQLLAGGCTTVLDVGNTGDALPVLAASPLRAFACVETLGLDPALAEPRFDAARSRIESHRGEKGLPTDRFRPGIAPHAAYSMSPELLRRVLDHQKSLGLPVTIHAAESREEAEMFASGTGPLADYCRRIYPDAPRHHGTSPVRWLEANGLFPDGLILVHGNILDEADMEILARRKATVVHCPSSHAFFGHPRFPYEALRARGINVALGTDSLASGDSLSMLEQMRLFAEAYPEVPLDEILTLASTHGAHALGLSDVGVLKAGNQADFIAVSENATEEPPKAFGKLSTIVLAGKSCDILAGV